MITKVNKILPEDIKLVDTSKFTSKQPIAVEQETIKLILATQRVNGQIIISQDHIFTTRKSS